MINIRAKGIKKLNRKLSRLAKKLDHPKKFYTEAKGLMTRDVSNHFREEEGPDGKWKSLDPATVLQRRKGSSQILQDTGRLRTSVLGSSKATRDYAVVGTNIDYAGSHNFGTDKIPQRKFLWLSQKTGKKLQRVLIDYIDGVLK